MEVDLMLRTIAKNIYKHLWLARFILPVDNHKVVIVSYYGRGFSDHPKYIAQKLHKLNPKLKIYWAIKDDIYKKDLPSYIRPVKYMSVTYVIHMTTARVWIDNSRKRLYEKKKRSQIYMQTWHANNACVKKVERHAEDKLSKEYLLGARQDARNTDIMISGSRFTDKCYRDSFWYPDGEILSVGSPRNDIFFGDTSATVSKVYKKLNIPKDTKIALYAPTFRNNHALDTYFLDFQKIADSFSSRFGGEWKVALRLHPNVAKKSSEMKLDSSDVVVDATHYDDMQELLVASDALITDYSSSVFDYILTKRPTFIHATDYDEYIAERGVYFDLKKLPFRFSDSSSALYKNIAKFDTKLYRKECETFMTEQGFYDKGDASIKTAEWINKHIK